HPASSSSGWDRMPLIAATPTEPVAHWTTRRLMPLPFQSRSSPRFAYLVHVIGVPRPDRLLVVLTDAGSRNLVDERPAFRQPPANNLVGQILSQVVGADAGSFLGDDDRQRAFLPALVGDRDHGGFDHIRMADQGVLQVDRRNPFAARLDHVFGPVGQGDEAVFIEAADVTGAQPAVVELGLVVAHVIGTGDPRTADLDLADGLVVVRQHLPVVVDDPGLDTAQRLTLGGAERPVL